VTVTAKKQASTINGFTNAAGVACDTPKDIMYFGYGFIKIGEGSVEGGMW
jgi:hypothetical protein